MTIIINQGMLDQIRNDPDEKFDTNNITFSINVDPSNPIQDLQQFFDFTFDPNLIPTSDNNRDMMIEAIELWDDVIGASITYSPGDEDANVTLNTADNFPANIPGSTYSTLHDSILPDDSDVYLDPTQIARGDFQWGTLLHEFGHALGLMHPGDYDSSEGSPTYENDRDFNEDTVQFTVMSYFSPAKFDPTINWTRGGNHPQTPMIYDILAIQQYYGTSTDTRLGNTTYGFNNTSGREIFNFATNTKPVLTIYDSGGDRDRLDVSGFAAPGAGVPAQRIDLHEGSYSDVGGLIKNVAIAFGTFIEEAVAGLGDDILIGNQFNNYLDGGAGNDNLSGELGDDTYVVDSASDVVVELEGQGTDTVNSVGASYTLSDHLERLIYTGVATSGFTGVGNGLGNELRGASDAGNTLDGRGGDDTMVGGSKDDVYIVDTLGDRTVEQSGGGSDTVRTAIGNYTLQDNVENLEFTGAGPLVTVGNDLDNRISGGASDDVVSGAGGNDTLNGNNGRDTLSGDAGNDRVNGGAGDDLLDGGADNDIVDGGDGNDQVSGGDGNDVVDGGSGNDGLAGGIGNDSIYGGDGSDALSGDLGDDELDGGAGDDTIAGGGGNDYIRESGGADAIDGGAGTDTVDYSTSTVGVEFGSDGVGTSGDARGDRLLNIEIVIGTAFADTLFGDAGDNTLRGGAGNDALHGLAGNDLLDGGSGSDAMTGGTGNDVYQVDDRADVVSELVGQGQDRVETTLDAYTLGTNVEDLAYKGTGAFAGIGNSLANAITGGASDDILRGGAGADTLDGLAGRDTADYSTSATGVAVNLATGMNTGGDAAGDTLVNMENVTGSAFNDLLTGDGGNNVLNGGAGNDTINGGGGNDRLIGGDGVNALVGGTGDDTYVVAANGTGTITESQGAGTDTVETSQSTATLSANVENLVYTGTGNFRGTGNALGNEITGASGGDNIQGQDGNDSLFGLAGNDTLFGENGNDTLDGGAGSDILDDKAGSDTFVFRAGDGGQDTIRGFTAGAASGDVIRILGTSWTSLDDVLNHLGAGSNSNTTVIELDATTSILVRGVAANQFTTGDFLFV